MDLRERKEFEARVPEIAAAVEKKPVGWINPRLVSMKSAKGSGGDGGGY